LRLKMHQYQTLNVDVYIAVANVRRVSLHPVTAGGTKGRSIVEMFGETTALRKSETVLTVRKACKGL
jgi:hypothetical protein